MTRKSGESKNPDDDETVAPSQGGSTSGPAFSIGTEFGDYRILNEIGRGGMGVVYRALDVKLDRHVALKVISSRLANDPSFRERFRNEARSAAQVDSPFVLPVYEAGDHDGLLYIASRLVPDGDLVASVESGLVGTTTTASVVVSQVAAALDAAHNIGLIHRDVKPANILVDSLEGAGVHSYLSDFGLSKGLEQAGAQTASGEILGSPEYMAPEQVRADPVSPATDQYALACVAFELFYGYPAFRRETQAGTLMAHLLDHPAWPEQGAAAENEALRQTLDKALALIPRIDSRIALSSATN